MVLKEGSVMVSGSGYQPADHKIKLTLALTEQASVSQWDESTTRG